MAVIRIVRIVLKILLMIIAMPFFAVWAWVKGRIFRRALAKELIAAGMPANQARGLAYEMRASNLLRKSNKRK